MFKNNRLRILITFSLVCSCLQPLAAELFTVRTLPNGTVTPLVTSSLSSKQQTTLYDIMMKHQWPTNTAFALTGELSQDMQQRLFAAQAGAEENVIRELIQHNVGADLDVVFIPTVLYELFIIDYLFAKTSPTFIKNIEAIINNVGEKNIREIFNKAHATQADILDGFKYNFVHNQNDGFFASFKKMFSNNTTIGPAQMAYFEINEQLGRYILEQQPAQSAQASFATIRQHHMMLGANLIQRQLAHLPSYADYTKVSKLIIPIDFTILAEELESDGITLKHNGIVARTIDIEYEAHDTNQGCIFRGTRPRAHVLQFNTPTTDLIIDSTLSKQDFDSFDAFWNAYQQQKLIPRSISYGNSLFAASISDPGACAFTYIVISSHSNGLGYGLLIDKKAYILNQCDDLFFIPPLPPLVALFARSAFCHPRCKAATTFDPSHGGDVQGFCGQSFVQDAAHFLLIQRDPLQHEKLFSRYLAHHARLLNQPQATDATYSTTLRTTHEHIADDIARR